jgi:hypothetical protein
MHNQLPAIDDADLDMSTVRMIAAEVALADIVRWTHRQKLAMPVGG